MPRYTHQQWQQLPAHLVAGVNPLAATVATLLQLRTGETTKMKQKTKLKPNRVHFTLHYTARARARAQALKSVILQHVAAVVAVAFAFAVAVRCEARERRVQSEARPSCN